MQTLLLKKHLLLQKGPQSLRYSCYPVSVGTVCWSGIGKTGGGRRRDEVVLAEVPLASCSFSWGKPDKQVLNAEVQLVFFPHA